MPQTNAGDLKMVTEWWQLRFIIRNPYIPPARLQTAPSDLSEAARYVSIERTQAADDGKNRSRP